MMRLSIRMCGLAAVSLLSISAAMAQTPVPSPRAPSEAVPTPAQRPSAVSSFAPQVKIAIPDVLTTAGITHSTAPTAIEGSLKTGLDAINGKDAVRALAIRNGMPQSLDRHILTWAIALSGAPGLPSSEIAAAASELPGWPGLATFRRNSERAMFKENPGPRTVISAFGDTMPQTVEGAILLARAHLAIGDTARARQVLSPFWRTEKLEGNDEQAILKEFAQVIPREDHLQRMLRMLYSNRLKSASRVAKLAGAESLYAAFAAVSQKSSDATQKLAAVHPSLQSNAAYIFATAQNLRRLERYRDAAAVIARAPRDAASLIDPDAWWTERRVLSRELLDQGDARLAYKVAAGHAAETPAVAAEAEFHAGWFALRALNDPKTASRHFSRIVEISSRPISASRGYYWLGRAADAGGGGDAKDYYRRAAAFGTTFYGQLAAAKLGQNTIDVPYPKPSAADRTRFEQREAVQAIRRLESLNSKSLAALIYRDLSQEMDSVGELALLANMAERSGNHFVGLRVGKTAASRGLDVGALSHPVGAIPENADIKGSGRALAYAIARQESEFNVGAVSSAGARGLLQLMPATAKEVAKRNGMAFSQPRLTNDAAYNATLGAHFLGEQIDRFDGSYILTFAGYNAGPRRAAEWSTRYGDPRGKTIDEVVDWIERIPFTETRNYVQRVMENYQVYKERLYGKVDIEKDLTQGRR